MRKCIILLTLPKLFCDSHTSFLEPHSADKFSVDFESFSDRVTVRTGDGVGDLYS